MFANQKIKKRLNQQQNQSEYIDNQIIRQIQEIKSCLQFTSEIYSPSMQSDPTKNVNQFNKFLANNKTFLNEKYVEYYTSKFPLQQLQTKARIQQSIKFIYDVFSFGKYESDDKMNHTLKKSLRQNILSFVKRIQSQYKKQESESIQYTKEMGVQLLKYCIQNNQMFAVHYDKKEKQPQKNQVEIQSPQKNNQQLIVQEKQIEKSQEILAESSQKIISQNQPQIENVSGLSSHLTVQAQQASGKALKKQAKIVFDFYCKQQLHSGGPAATFDKILHQTSTMTLGKFMAFANTAGILDISRFGSQSTKKPLNKKTINEIFRKVGQSSKQIEFQTFFSVLKELYKIDNSVYDKLCIGKNEGANQILRKLKYLNTPFNMKDLGAKQKSMNITDKPYIPIATGHSGRFENSLKEDIEDRKQKLRYLPMHPYPNKNVVKSMNQSSFIKQSRIGQSNLKISKIGGIEESLARQNYLHIQPEKQHKNVQNNINKIRLQNSRIDLNGMKLLDDNQMGILQDLIMPDDNDDDFLKEYKIPKLHSNIGLRKIDRHQVHTSRQNQQDIYTSKYHIGQNKNRKNVVGQLKNRIKEVQKTQRKQQTSLQSKRRGAHSLYNKK